MSEVGSDEQAETVVAGADHGPKIAAGSIGDAVGRYVVLEEVGQGAMGRVLRAYDPKLEREVAVKEVLGQALGAEGSARLVREARAMAKLSHPNVVAVYDIEELAGHRFALVMQYVAGQTLRRWLDAEQRPWRAVVRHFIAAGRGLAAAHAVGLLHRDFKPANVLVERGGAIKVTDFGLAKTADDRTEVTDGAVAGMHDRGPGDDLTQTGTVLGTPRYMAPEQHAGVELTAAADQFAFCVALWEALCGEPPFFGESMADDKHTGPGQWSNAAVPSPIVEALRRGLAASPMERHPTMTALLRALQKGAARRRSRWGLVLGGLAVAGTVAAVQSQFGGGAKQCTGAADQMVGIWDPARRAEIEGAMLGIDARYAQAAWDRAANQLDEYLARWVAMHGEVCAATAIRGEQSTEVMDLRMACLHRAKLGLRAVTNQLADADPEVVSNAHKLTSSLRPLSRCADVDALQANVEPPLPADADGVEWIQTLLAEAAAAREAGRYASARSKVETASEALPEVQYGPIHTEVALARALVLDELGEYDAAEVAVTEAVRLASLHRQWGALGRAASLRMFVVGYRLRRPEEGLRDRAVAHGTATGDAVQEARAYSNLAQVLVAQGKYDEAEAELGRALELQEAALGSDHPAVATSRSNLGNVLEWQGRAPAAEAEHRRALAIWEAALGPDHPDVATSRGNLAVAIYGQGRLQEAEAEHRRAIALKIAALGPDHPKVARSRNNLALSLGAQGKNAEAEVEYRRALATWEKALGPDHLVLAEGRNNLAGVLDAQGKSAEAETEYRLALEAWKKSLGSEHPNIAKLRANLAVVLFEHGQFVEAESEHRSVLAALSGALGPDHPDVARSHHNLGNALAAQGKYAEAQTEYRTALTSWEVTLGPDHPDVAMARHGLAALFVARGRPTQALEYAEKAWDRRKRGDVDPTDAAKTAFVLAEVRWSSSAAASSRTEARALAERALQLYADGGEVHRAAADDVRAWLDGHR